MDSLLLALNIRKGRGGGGGGSRGDSMVVGFNGSYRVIELEASENIVWCVPIDRTRRQDYRVRGGCGSKCVGGGDTSQTKRRQNMRLITD